MAGTKNNVARVYYQDEQLTTLNAGQTLDLDVNEHVMLGNLKIVTDGGFIKPDGRLTINSYDDEIDVNAYRYANTLGLKPSGRKDIYTYDDDISVSGKATANTLPLQPKALNQIIRENRDYSASDFSTDYGRRGISSFSVNVVAQIDDLDDLTNLMEIDALIGEEN